MRYSGIQQIQLDTARYVRSTDTVTVIQLDTVGGITAAYTRESAAKWLNTEQRCSGIRRRRIRIR